MWPNPTVQMFQQQYFRDFPFGFSNGDLSQVQDQDIQNAIGKAALFINPSLYASQAAYNNGFMALAAHYLVLAIRASSQGISGQWPWMVTSKGVGGVSEGITIPQWILDNPMWSVLTSTTYGMDFLFGVLPNLVGQCFTIFGPTHP
jgi:Protein of unknown function (DUF4054)